MGDIYNYREGLRAYSGSTPASSTDGVLDQLEGGQVFLVIDTLKKDIFQNFAGEIFTYDNTTGQIKVNEDGLYTIHYSILIKVVAGGTGGSTLISYVQINNKGEEKINVQSNNIYMTAADNDNIVQSVSGSFTAYLTTSDFLVINLLAKTAIAGTTFETVGKGVGVTDADQWTHMQVVKLL